MPELDVFPERDWYPERTPSLADAIDQAVALALEYNDYDFMTQDPENEGVPVQMLEDDTFIVGYGEIFLPTVGYVLRDLTWKPLLPTAEEEA